MDINRHPPTPSPIKREGEIETAGKSVLDELAQWERFALNRLNREAKPDARPFEVNALPDELAFEVSAGLMFAGDREAVKSVFAAAREGGGGLTTSGLTHSSTDVFAQTEHLRIWAFGKSRAE